MKFVIILLILLFVSPVSAHRRYIAYATDVTTDNTGAGYTAITGLGMPALIGQTLLAKCTIITSSPAATTGALIGVTGPTTGGPTVTGMVQQHWPELEGSQINYIYRSGDIDGACIGGYTCIGAVNSPFENGDIVRFRNAGDMGQIVGVSAVVENKLANYIELAIDSSLFTPWAGIGAIIERVPPPKQYFNVLNFSPSPTVIATSPGNRTAEVGTMRIITNVQVVLKNGTTAGTLQPTISASNNNATVTAHIGSVCEYTYEVGD